MLLEPATGPVPTPLPGQQEGPLLSENQRQELELRISIRSLHWHEKVLPLWKTLLPRAHAMVTSGLMSMSTQTQDLLVCKAPAGSSGTLSTVLFAQPSTDLTFTGRYFRGVTQSLIYPAKSDQ